METKATPWNLYFQGKLRVWIERTGNTTVEMDEEKWLCHYFAKALKIVTKQDIKASDVLPNWEIVSFSPEKEDLAVRRRFTWNTIAKEPLKVFVDGDELETEEIVRGSLRLYFATAFRQKYEKDIPASHLERDWRFVSFCPEERKLIVEKA